MEGGAFSWFTDAAGGVALVDEAFPVGGDLLPVLLGDAGRAAAVGGVEFVGAGV